MTVKLIASFVAVLASAYLPMSAWSVANAAPVETTPTRTESGATQLADDSPALASMSTSSDPFLLLGTETTDELHAQSSPTTVEYIEITTDGNRVLIRTDRRVEDYDTYWDRANLAYAIKIPNARFGSDLTLPDVSSSSAIQWVNAEQDAYGNIIIYVMPAPQVSVRGVNEPSTQMLALELQPYGVHNSDGVGTTTNNGSTTSDGSSLNNLPDVSGDRIVVVVDPGHGGPDPGAVGIGGLREIDVVTPVSNRVAALLRESGVESVLTRTGDYDLDLDPRVDLANRIQANLFVSIHANAISLSRPDVNGLETYYYQSGDRLADTIHESLIDATDSNDRGVRTARFYVLRYTDMPSVLLELGFVTGDEDAPRLRDPDYQETLARGITRGILEYIERYCPGPYCEP
jgi:N-acetylmuramoyl-L-alanine amidase